MKWFKFGIWARLLFAFGGISAITIVAGLSAIYLFERSNALFTTITDKHLPEVIQAAEFADIGARIIAMAPSFVSAPNEETRSKISSDLEQLLNRINDQTRTLQIKSNQRRQDIDQLLQQMRNNLLSLQQTVSQRLALQQLMTQSTEKLRWLYIDLLDEVEPLNQDLAYNLDSEIERLIRASPEKTKMISVSRLHANRVAKEAAEKIGANGELLVSIILQVPTSTTVDRIEELETLSADTISFLRTKLAQLAQVDSTVSLRQILAEIFSLAENRNSVFILKRGIISETISGERILAENRNLVSRLRKLIDQIVTSSQADAFSAITTANENFKQTRGLLIFMGLLSLATAASVLWFYVRGNIVSRLNNLETSMLAIADGNLDHHLPKIEDDEIGKMTAALKVFRDTAQTVEDANAQAIIDNAAVGLIITNVDGTIRFLNSTAVELFATTADAMAGHSLSSLLVATDHEKLLNLCSEALTGQQVEMTSTTFQGIKKMGETFPVDISIHPIRQRNQLRLIVTVHDVTEREMAQAFLELRVQEKTQHLSRVNIRLQQEIEERKKVQDELVQAGKLAALGQMSAGIAHEFNQPLSAIRHYIHNAGLFLKRGELENLGDNLVKVEELTGRMAKISNHLKTFSRRSTNELSPVSIATSVERALSLLKARLKKKSVRLINNIETSPLKVMAEDIRLEQVLVNLIGNAIDAVIEQPENERQIIINAVEQTDQVKLDIIDSGPGIPPDLVEMIFDPFHTTKEVGKGLGLGLSISYNIIKDFGGMIEVSITEEDVTKFSVTLKKVLD